MYDSRAWSLVSKVQLSQGQYRALVADPTSGDPDRRVMSPGERKQYVQMQRRRKGQRAMAAREAAGVDGPVREVRSRRLAQKVSVISDTAVPPKKGKSHPSFYGIRPASIRAQALDTQRLRRGSDDRLNTRIKETMVRHRVDPGNAWKYALPPGKHVLTGQKLRPGIAGTTEIVGVGPNVRRIVRVARGKGSDEVTLRHEGHHARGGKNNQYRFMRRAFTPTRRAAEEAGATLAETRGRRRVGRAGYDMSVDRAAADRAVVDAKNQGKPRRERRRRGYEFGTRTGERRYLQVRHGVSRGEAQRRLERVEGKYASQLAQAEAKFKANLGGPVDEVPKGWVGPGGGLPRSVRRVMRRR